MINKLSYILNKFFRSNIILWFVKYYNLIILSVFTIGCFIYLFDINIYKSIYVFLVGILGFNLSSLIFVGYVVSRLKFCTWQILAYIFNVLINVIWLILKFLSLFVLIQYDNIIITILSSIFLSYTLVYYIKYFMKYDFKRRTI